VATALTATFGMMAIGFGAAGASTVAYGGLNAAVTQTASLNWAGYADAAPAGSVTYVAGTWVEPAVACSAQGTQYAAFWVGIDGFNSNTVEQTGTLAQCSHGVAKYSAWWELYPLNSIQTIGSITVHPGDSISASVAYSTAGFTMAIKDVTTGKSFSTAGTQSGTSRSSAECIAERPSVERSLTSLADFGTMTFSSCTSTISGTTQGIGAYTNSDAITMVNSAGMTLAAPSGTSNSGATFSITWERSK
jgi:hypothetical protein